MEQLNFLFFCSGYWKSQKKSVFRQLEKKRGHHNILTTFFNFPHFSSDLGLALNCQYDLSNRTIINDFDLAIEGEIEPSLFEEAVVDSPNVLMKITERGGGDVDSAQVGQEVIDVALAAVALVVEIVGTYIDCCCCPYC